MSRRGPFQRARILAAAAVAVAAIGACTNHGNTNWIYSSASPWPTRSFMPPDTNGWYVVTNNLDDTLSFIDPASMTTGIKLPVGINPVELEGPHHLTVSSDGQYVLMGLGEIFPTNASGPHGSHGSGSVPGYLMKVRVSDGKQVGQVRVDRNPGDIVLSPDGSKAYVSHFDVKRILDQTQAGGTEESKWSGIAVVDIATMTREALVMICPAEHGMAVTPDGTTMYVACYGGDTIAKVDLTQATLPSTIIPAGPNPQELPNNQLYQPYAVTLSSDAQIAWISCWASGDIRPLHLATGVVDTANAVVVGGYPAFGDRWGREMIFARQSGTPGIFDDHLLVIGSNGNLIGNLTLSPTQCKNAHAAMDLRNDPDRALLVCEGDHINPGTLLKIDLPTLAVLSTAQLGVFPDGVTAVPPGGAP